MYSNKGMAQRCTEEVVLETVTAVPVWIHVEEAGLKPLGPDVSSLSDPTDWESRCTEPRVYGIYKKKTIKKRTPILTLPVKRKYFYRYFFSSPFNSP